jgi:hypothetical protein
MVPDTEQLITKARKQHATLGTLQQTADKFLLLWKKLKNGVGMGLDELPAESLKHANRHLATMFALFTHFAITVLYFPPGVMEGTITYHLKPQSKPLRLITTFKSYRPIRASSIPGKGVERMVAEPIWPLDEPDREWFDPAQFAPRKHHSSAQLAFILGLILHYRKRKPTYIILVDISQAFDTLWKEGLWLKLLLKGVPLRTVAILAALYKGLSTRIKRHHRGFTMDNGLPQGSANASFLYTTFINDIPELLRKDDIALHFLTLLVHCLIFLDDISQ